MGRQGGRIVIIYLVALTIGLVLQFDRLGPWIEAKFDDNPPPGVREVLAALSAWHQNSGLGALARAFDCALAPAFGGNYKNTYFCKETNLAGAKPVQNPGPAGPAVPGDQAQTPAGTSSLMVVGDSLAVSLATSLEKTFRGQDGLGLIPKGKIASGLQNPHFYDWELAMRQFLMEYEPDVVVVMMGANDAKYLSLDPQANPPAALRDRHFAVYEARARRFVSVLEDKGVRCYWIGLPIMGDAVLAAKSQALNAVIRQVCEESKVCRYVDVWSSLADQQGQYAPYLTDGKGERIKVRQDDRIHFSPAGGDIIVRALLKEAGELSGLLGRPTKSLAENTRGLVPGPTP
jgi:hypothetical protein